MSSCMIGGSGEGVIFSRKSDEKSNARDLVRGGESCMYKNGCRTQGVLLLIILSAITAPCCCGDPFLFSK